MSTKQSTAQSALYTQSGVPPLGEAIPLALQHVVAMVVGCISMP